MSIGQIREALQRELEEIQAALEARGGLHVLAVQASKIPYGKGKDPRKDINAKLGRADRPGDPRLCWSQVVMRGGLPAIVPGASNLVCVDIDEGEPKELWRKHRPLFWVKTKSFEQEGKTGLHFFYDHPNKEEIGNSKWELEGCKGDIRADKGYCIIWDRADFLKKLSEINGKHRPLPPEFLKKKAKPASQRSNGSFAWANGVQKVAMAPEGERNETLNCEVFLAAKNGKLTPELEAEFRSAARMRGLGEKEVEATIDSAKRAGEAERVPTMAELRKMRQQRSQEQPAEGQQQQPREEPVEPQERPVERREEPAREKPAFRQPSSGGAPRYPRTKEGLEAIFEEMGISVRFDDRDAALYFWADSDFGDRDIPAGEWVRQSDNLDAKLKASIARRFENRNATPWMISVQKWQEFLLAIAPIVDPVKLWLEELPEWDGKPRLDTLIEDSGMKAAIDREDDDAVDLLAWASRAVVMTATYRTLNPGAECEEIVVLIGEQDWGKSTFAKMLVHEERFHGDQLSFASPPKEQVEATLGKSVIEISEMAGTARAETTEIKRFLTRRSDEVRLAYMRSPSRRPRRFALIGTSNENVLPNDPTGNRRFVTVELEWGDPLKVRRYLGQEGLLEQLYAEALVRIAKGETPRLPMHLKKTQAEINEDFRRADPMEEEIKVALPSMPPFFTPSKMAIRLGMIEKDQMLDVRGGRRLAQAMRAAGMKESKRYVCRDHVRRRLYDNRANHKAESVLFDDDLQELPNDYDYKSPVDSGQSEPI